MDIDATCDLIEKTWQLSAELEEIIQASKSVQTSEPDLDDELRRSAAIAQATMLRWRLQLGSEAGILPLSLPANDSE